MRWNNFTGTAVIPTFARLVLGMAFITAGLHKVARHVEYTAEEAATLRTEFNVNLDPVQLATAVTLYTQMPEPQEHNEEAKVPPAENEPVQAGETTAAPVEKPAAQTPPSTPPSDPPAANSTDKPQDEAKPTVKEVPPVIIEIPEEVKPKGTAPPADAGQKYRGLALLHVALLLHDNGIPNGYALAWIAALTEFVGGVLILVGLFSRVWGLGLAIAMGMAFYLTSMESYFSTVGPFESAGADGHTLFNQVFSQLGLGVLALTVFLVGPGPISLDRLIFRPKREGIEVEEGKG